MMAGILKFNVCSNDAIQHKKCYYCTGLVLAPLQVYNIDIRYFWALLFSTLLLRFRV
jgi:hypothetical protein